MGVDPFYRGLKWEVQPEQCEEESGGSKARKGEPAFSAVAYVREWGDLAYKALGKPAPLPPWPPPLHAALRSEAESDLRAEEQRAEKEREALTERAHARLQQLQLEAARGNAHRGELPLNVMHGHR